MLSILVKNNFDNTQYSFDSFLNSFTVLTRTTIIIDSGKYNLSWQVIERLEWNKAYLNAY